MRQAEHSVSYPVGLCVGQPCLVENIPFRVNSRNRYFRLLDVVALGREQAINLGVRYDQIVQRMLMVVAVMVSVSTALVGPITFLGLLVANLGRQFMRSFHHRYIISASVLISVIALIGGQLLLERVLNFAAPISVVINLTGGLYFIYLLLKENAI